MEKNTPNERIKWILKQENCSIHQLAGGNNNLLQKFYRQINVGAPLTADILRIILTTFPQYNHMWILNGEGEVKESGIQGMKKSNYGDGCKPNVYDPNVVECCEPGAVFNAATEGKLNGYIAMPGAPANVFYIKTDDDAMESADIKESIPKGSFIAVRSTKDTYIRWGMNYVICTSSGIFVRKLMPSQNDGYVLCKSNKDEKYPSFEIPKKEILGMALVVGVVYGYFFN